MRRWRWKDEEYLVERVGRGWLSGEEMHWEERGWRSIIGGVIGGNEGGPWGGRKKAKPGTMAIQFSQWLCA